MASLLRLCSLWKTSRPSVASSKENVRCTGTRSFRRSHISGSEESLRIGCSQRGGGAAAGGDHLRERREAVRVVDEVHKPLDAVRTALADCRDDVLTSVVDRLRGAKAADVVLLLWPSGGDHPCAAPGRELHRVAADAAGGADDEHALTLRGI